MKKLLIEFAYDVDKNVVKVSEAKKDDMYFCPSCGEKLVYKNSGRTGIGTRRPHFSHLSHSNCNESPLHAIFKDKVAGFLMTLIQNKENFSIDRKCKACEKKMVQNLLPYGIVKIEKEYSFGKNAPQPDIALIDKEGKVKEVIEVVVTHKPEEKTIDFYKRKNILLYQYNINDEDIYEVESRLLFPDVAPMWICDECYYYRHLYEKMIVTAKLNRQRAFCQLILQKGKYRYGSYVYERRRLRKRKIRL